MKNAFNAYGERKLWSTPSDISRDIDKSYQSIDNIIRPDYPETGLTTIKSVLNYSASRGTIFVVDVKKLFSK